ncbi:MAG: J domain-containing protein [Polyangiaceae bacterium]|nr:J domain-containing protein [Polyangiaceae bacterium]
MRVGPCEARLDLYAVLGVTSVATQAEVRAAYRRLARTTHPDLAGDAAAERMKLVNLAAAILLDPGARARYDALRAPSPRWNGYFPPERPSSPRPSRPAWTGPVRAPASLRRPSASMRELVVGLAAALSITLLGASVAHAFGDVATVASGKRPSPVQRVSMWAP